MQMRLRKEECGRGLMVDWSRQGVCGVPVNSSRADHHPLSRRPPPMPAPVISNKSPGQAAQDMSVILVTGSYDHEIRFWEAWSGICSRTITRSGESGVRSPLSFDQRQPSVTCV